MSTRFLLGAILACTLSALVPLDNVHAQAKDNAQTKDNAQPKDNAPVAGAAVLGVTVEERALIAKGYRASKLLKKEVYNDKGQKIGKIDDFVIAPDGKLSIAVIDVGGFLGLGKHLVAIPVQQFAHMWPKAVLPNASKDQVKALPPFAYA